MRRAVSEVVGEMARSSRERGDARVARRETVGAFGEA
jgi:hypothetical protein